MVPRNCLDQCDEGDKAAEFTSKFKSKFAK